MSAYVAIIEDTTYSNIFNNLSFLRVDVYGLNTNINIYISIIPNFYTVSPKKILNDNLIIMQIICL